MSAINRNSLVQFVQGNAYTLHHTLYQVQANEIKGYKSLVQGVQASFMCAHVNVILFNSFSNQNNNKLLNPRVEETLYTLYQPFKDIFFNALAWYNVVKTACTPCTNTNFNKDMS